MGCFGYYTRRNAVIYKNPSAIVRSVGRARHVDLVEDKNTHEIFTKKLKILRIKMHD